MIKRILKIIVGVFFSLVILLFVLFYRPDRSIASLEETYFTTQSHYQDIEITSLDDDILSIKIHYQDYGQSLDPVVVLLHGAFASSHTFDPWALMLVDAGYRVITIDLPYHGLSGGFSDHITSLRRSAAVVHELLQTLEIHSFFIGGNSMGGGVSWFYASSYHGVDDVFIEGLILIDAVPPTLSSGGSRFRSPFLTHPLVSPIASKMTPRFLLRTILNGVYGSDSNVSDDTVTRYYELILKEGYRESILKNTTEIIPLTSPTSIERMTIIKDFNIPILVMWGIEDSWIPVDTVSIFEDLLALSDDDIVIYDGLGHVPMEENPTLTFVDLIDFLDRHQ
ncbi:MAG: alpha/beta fold hydrolase [Acholeplasmataceae bacterium]